MMVLQSEEICKLAPALAVVAIAKHEQAYCKCYKTEKRPRKGTA